MTGKRNDGIDPYFFDQGDYGKWREIWWGKCPLDGNVIANLQAHQVTEHEDGTITVSPSIKVSKTSGEELWHGFLERGVWRSC